MHLFKNDGYAASVPGFTKALELFPGHFLASRNLAIAKQRAASGVAASGGRRDNVAGPEVTAADDTSGSGLGWLWPGLLLALTLLVAGAVLVLLLAVDGRPSARWPGARTVAAHLRWPAPSWRAGVTGRPAVGWFPAPGAGAAGTAVAAAAGTAAARGSRPAHRPAAAHRSDPTHRPDPAHRPDAARAASPVGATPSARPRTAPPPSTGSAPTAATSARRRAAAGCGCGRPAEHDGAAAPQRGR